MKIVPRNWEGMGIKTHWCIGNENFLFPFLTRASLWNEINAVYGNGNCYTGLGRNENKNSLMHREWEFPFPISHKGIPLEWKWTWCMEINYDTKLERNKNKQNSFLHREWEFRFSIFSNFIPLEWEWTRCINTVYVNCTLVGLVCLTGESHSQLCERLL